MYSCGHQDNPPYDGEKADAVDAVEGSSPESVMASDQDTTGV